MIDNIAVLHAGEFFNAFKYISISFLKIKKEFSLEMYTCEYKI